MQKDKTELEVTRMTKENIQYLDVFFAVANGIRLITTTPLKNSVRSSMRLQHTNFP